LIGKTWVIWDPGNCNLGRCEKIWPNSLSLPVDNYKNAKRRKKFEKDTQLAHHIFAWGKKLQKLVIKILLTKGKQVAWEGN